MRRYKYRRKFELKLSGWVKVLLFLGILFLILIEIDMQLRPVITTMAEYQCRVVSILAMNEAVMDELEQEPNIGAELVHVDTREDGSVVSVEIDSVEMNRLQARLTDAVTNRLLGIQQQDIGIPLGTLTGWQLLAGRGPKIHLQILPTSFVESDIVDSLETAGINQTQHRIFIDFKVEMSAIMPGYSTSVVVENQVCVAQTLIVGEVPQFYAGN
ncbi:sporulation protein YunB [uncultured Ruthenibacterium sp.]|uniref:sporulation protein YunB n=1 Tax=uncultured Ruthenibacterium sp. TaxID=1905347 RepID=UPI00349E5AF8